MTRIGQGFDVHAFGEGDHVVLGGVRIAHDRGVVAHSDGDVVIHALCDAMLGALALGDIGQHFPPGDPQWRGADSRAFLRRCNEMLAERGWKVGDARGVLVFNQYEQMIQAAISGQGVAIGRLELLVAPIAENRLRVLEGSTRRSEGCCWLIQADKDPPEDVRLAVQWILSLADEVAGSDPDSPESPA
jgi:2-C-methyl-D-erythritol 2,4-cyclodiphosphate synthase